MLAAIQTTIEIFMEYYFIRYILVPELTESTINTASVQVYFGKDNDTWLALPTTTVASTNYFMGYSTSVNSVQVLWDYNGIGIGENPNAFFGITSLFKVVIIPPARKANPDLDLTNYKEVKKRFNLNH
jgi:hypothetical protein